MRGVLVRTTMPGTTLTAQAATSVRQPSTSTVHRRQLPDGSSSRWWQRLGIAAGDFVHGGHLPPAMLPRLR